MFGGNYCNHCGQSANTKRINAEFLWEDIQHGIFHYDKGIGYSLKKLFENPGSVIREYINGKRANHFRPISMVIILATVYALIYHIFELNHRSSLDEPSEQMLEKIFAHYYYFVVATIPVFALMTFTLFRKVGYNFYEVIILEAFKSSQRLSIHIISLPILYFFKEKASFTIITNLLFIVDLVLILWTNRQFFNKIKMFEVIFRSLITYIMYFIVVFLLVAVYILLFTNLDVY
ncbi:hypothetical protein CHRY9393_02670 [Chryseobacterium fistulae]|uniref:DUF3667 domain-containing protein n=2 Tax=Chryseobacterium fistulae TaxID=2675058 RepID=A0A6N4XUT3_9FLAO|nr:hypothetical protein CHRY9393_02670 [Chryseobacterium fistulae]